MKIPVKHKKGGVSKRGTFLFGQGKARVAV